MPKTSQAASQASAQDEQTKSTSINASSTPTNTSSTATRPMSMGLLNQSLFMNIHSHDSMTPVSPKSPPLDAFRGNGAAVGPALLDTAASVSAKLDSSSSSAGLSVASLVLALKAKLAHGHVHDHFAAARNNLFDADPLSAANNAAAAEYISTLDCMELASLLMPLLKRDVLTGIPTEIAFKVLEYMDMKTIVGGRLVCKAWLGLIDGRGADLAIWKRKVALEFPHLMIQSPDPMDEKLHMRTFKAYYQFNFQSRRNWFLGRNKRISFPGHGGNVVTSLLVVGDKIISGSDDMSIHIYDINKGELTKRLLGHDGGVWALQNYGNALVSGSTDRTVRVWNIETGKCTHVFDGHTSTVRCLLIIPQDGVEGGESEFAVAGGSSSSSLAPSLSGSRRPTSAMMSRSTSSVFNNNNANSGASMPAVSSSKPPLFVTGSRDANIRVWTLPDLSTNWSSSSNPSTPNPYLRHVLQGHTNSVRAIAGHANILVSGSYDTTVRVWDILTGTCLHVFHAHREKVYSVGYSHTLKRAVSGSMDATVRVWDTVSGTPLFTLEGHNSLVGLLELTPSYLISAAADSTLRVWDPMSGKCLAILSGHDAAITCFMHDPLNNRIVSGSDGGIKVWELSSGGYAGVDMHSLSHVVPASNDRLVDAPCFTQTPKGPKPIHGRFVGDAITGVRGVWRTRMDSYRLVSAVQTSDEKTWFEVLDFSEGPELGVFRKTAGDRFFRDENGEEAGGEEMEDDDEMDEDVDFDEEDM